MRFVFRLAFSAVSASLLHPASPPQASVPADLILENGAIYTVDAARSWAQAIAIAGTKIVYTGTDSGVQAFRGAETKVVDLDGRMVLPGFHDSHVHLIQGGQTLLLCNLRAAQTSAEALAIVARCASERPAAPWIVGDGWELFLFSNANPHKEDLDRIVPERPAFLESSDGHSAWVNSKALELAGIRKDTPDPPGGRIERDARTGEPSGTLRELATELVSNRIPKETGEQRLRDLRRGLEEAHRFGIISFQDADTDDELLQTYASAEKNGELTARVVGALHVDPRKDDSQVAELAAKREKYLGKRFRPTAVKIFADGVIEPGTASMLEPYLGRLAGKNGELNFDPERLKRLVTELDRAGFQVHIHAIGDRAVRVSLDAHQAAQQTLGQRDLRPHIAHLEVIEPEDIPRFRQLNVIANFQGLWAWADHYIKDLTLPILGAQRSRWLYPIRSVIRTGATIAGGSDWPVSSLNPLDAMQVAVTRRGISESEGPAWIPEETADLPTMIAAYTINGAWVNHEEKETGSIEPGKAADLVVLDHNIFALRPEKIHEAKVLITVLDGKPVYRDPAFAFPRK